MLLIKRARPPFQDCWAFPGGFVDYGEDPIKAVTRELQEETHLRPLSGSQPHLVTVKGDPTRDPRQHIVTMAYAVQVDPASLNELRGDDDAKEAKWFHLDVLERGDISLAFDHGAILEDFLKWFREGVSPGQTWYQ